MATTTSGTTTSDGYTASEWTQQTMLSDLMQQKGLLIGLGLAIVATILLLPRRSAPEEKAARRLVRDWHDVDDVDDARELLGENLPPIVRPALLIALEELEHEVHRGFRALEKEIKRL